jgi:hypothetical protein
MAALILGVLVVGAALARKESLIFPRVTEGAWVKGCAVAAASLSLAYVAFYLHGGPRIIDATAYMHQAHALANGHFGGHVPLPSESFRGRFLIYDEGAGKIAGLFPPGYPLLLSLGVRLGAPMVVGPLLAFALVFATARLAREMCQRTSLAESARGDVVRVATVSQVLCATMRYHTADTMSHGLAALLVTCALAAALFATRAERPFGAQLSAFVSAGCIGWLLCTRLASAPPIFLLAVVLVGRARPRLLVPFALGLLPGIALLLASQAATTGSAFVSAQKLYYARSDGPASCFRYGFGADVGCMFEHGDFVRARLSSGYGLVSALGVTLRRLRAHLTDIQNLELLALVPLVVSPATKRAARLGLLLVLLFVLSYAPFYFDGNYPGGGARFFADVLPVEHVLFALGAFALAERLKRAPYTRVAGLLVGLGLVGFAVHASADHRLLRDREGGRPMFERDVLTSAGVTHGLVLVDTDHGFLLGHEPRERLDAKKEIVVARQRGDATDRVLFDALGAPPTWLYDRGDATHEPRLVPFNVPEARVSGVPGFRFEAENEWPALSAAWSPEQDGYAYPAWASGGCASAGRVLRITPGHQGKARVLLALPIPEDRPYWLSVRVRGSGSGGTMHIQVDGTAMGPAGTSFDVNDPEEGICVDLPPREIHLRSHGPRDVPSQGGIGEAHVEVSVRGAGLAIERPSNLPMDLDALTLRP